MFFFFKKLLKLLTRKSNKGEPNEPKFETMNTQYGICEECNQPNISIKWCKECNAKRFQQNFTNWTSGNDNIDKFIQDTQLSAEIYEKVLEWIPYDRFRNIEYIAKGGFGNVYKANWIDGFIGHWDNKNKIWNRLYSNELFVLKSLNKSKNVTLEFINEITLHNKLNVIDLVGIVEFYGITQDPKTKNYMMVLEYANEGSLRNYLNTNKNNSWKDKLNYLCCIARGLNEIHKKDIIHQDLHIADFGLCKPADYNNNAKKGIYGVLPYVAPEVLRSQNSQNYTKASDIYSFGIIMYEVISGLPPYYYVSHNEYLAMKICNGLRPKFNTKVPQLIVNSIKRCLDANPSNRPTAKELDQILEKWYSELYYNQQTEIDKQIREADEINKNLSTSNSSTNLGLSYKTHPEAVYTSRLLNFNNLIEPKNSDDYYEHNDNIVSKEFLESLKIDFSQLKINDDAEEKK